MADEHVPMFRFRGAIAPSAAVKRPVAVRRNATDTAGGDGTSTSATVDIFDVIDSWGGWWGVSAGEVDEALAKVSDVDTLYVRINSPGGEATEGVAIANLLRAHPATVHVTNYGLAASAASLIAVSGDTLSMAPGSLLMIHEAWNVVAGSADDMRAEAGVLDKISDSYAAVYALKGGTKSDWRALMHAETWFTPSDAVASGLADKVGIDAAPGMPVCPPEDDEMPIEVNVDIEITPAARAAARFDLSMFTNLPAAARAAHKSPAEPPEKHPHPKEAVNMTPDEIKALRERLGLADDADVSAINAKLDELEEAATNPTGPTEVTDEQALAALAKATGVAPETVKAAVDGAKAGKVTVSQSFLDALEGRVAAGEKALARQDREDRDTAIAAAQAAGKIGRDEKTVASWQRDWDRDSEATKAELEKLPARFPVGQAQGYAGSDETDGDGTKPFTDNEAEALASLTGTKKEALLHE